MTASKKTAKTKTEKPKAPSGKRAAKSRAAPKKKAVRERKLSNDSKYLGSIFAEIAGMQYYEAGVSPGDNVQLEREPDNEHDGNAIRIENKHFHQAGHVPRRISVWLAPLIDAGEVWVEGRVAESSKIDRPDRVFILIELYLRKKGRHMLAHNPDPKDLPDALHQSVLAIWNESDRWSDGDTVSELATRLKALDTEDLLPKTRMLLALFKHRAWELRRRAGERTLEDVRSTLRGIELGRPLFHRNLTVFPLMSKNGRAPDYLLLEEAIKGKKAEVREVSEAGSVPELLVDNRAPLPILIPEGEILIGAKQNRTVNITILIAPNTEYVIPVSCVEQGRWTTTSRTLAASHFATPGLRAGKIASSQAQRRTTGRALSDQSQVWLEVARSLGAAGAASATGSLTDAFETAKARTKKYREKLVFPKGTFGVLVASGGEIAGMDLFDSPKTLRKFWPRLSESYFFEAAFHEKRKKTARATAAGFLKVLPAIIRFVEKPAGLGRELEFSDDAYAGSGLWYNGRLCHLSAFRVKTAQSPGDPAGRIS
jgi:hypothetical protein